MLADPGTYCYHGEPRWRSYFRSTLAHNTIEVGGQDQSTSGGPFLWTRQAQSRLIELETERGRGDHRVVRRARRLPDAHPAAASPPVGPTGQPAPATRDRRPPRDDGRTRLPAGVPPWPRHRCPTGRDTMSSSPGPTGLSRARHALLPEGPLLVALAEGRPTRSSGGTPRVSERNSRPGPSSERERAAGPAPTPSRPCSSSIRELGLPASSCEQSDSQCPSGICTAHGLL